MGEVAPWALTGKSSSKVARGVVAHPPGTARTASGTGTGQELGAVAAQQRMYAALHVLSVSGTASITARVESDADNTFAAATTQLTFTAAASGTSPQGQFLTTDGTAITDTWWRPAWTITGTGSVLFVVSLGIA